MGNQFQNIIITGAPGTGKTTLINAIRRRGFFCFDEVSRDVITHQQQCGGNCFPWDNVLGYSIKVIDVMQNRYIWDCTDRVYFFDRAVPDVIAYLNYYNSEVPDSCFKELQKFPISSTLVFFAPFWDDIYINDLQRPESFADAMKISESLFETYSSLKYNIIELPKISVDERVDFILSKIKKLI